MPTTPEFIRSRQRLALIGTAALLAVLTVVQSLFYLYGYEFEADLYQHGPLPTLTMSAWLIAAIGAILVNLPLPGKATCFELKIRSTVWTDAVSLLTAASLLATLALPILLMNDTTDMLGILLTSAAETDATAKMMLIASLVLAIPSAFHFILSFAHHKTYPQSACALLFWTAFAALRVYFDMRYLLTSPRRIMHLVALLAVIFFLIVELRQARGIVTGRLYGIGASIVIVIAGCDAICNLLLAAMGWVSLGSEISTYLFLLCIALYAAARLCALCTAEKAPVSEATEAPTTLDAPDCSAPSEASAEEETP